MGNCGSVRPGGETRRSRSRCGAALLRASSRGGQRGVQPGRQESGPPHQNRDPPRAPPSHQPEVPLPCVDPSGDGASKDRLSKATLYATLSALKRFFIWLAGQPGYKSRISYSDAEYFNLSVKEIRIAK
jgi:hypothetical protein